MIYFVWFVSQNRSLWNGVQGPGYGQRGSNGGAQEGAGSADGRGRAHVDAPGDFPTQTDGEVRTPQHRPVSYLFIFLPPTSSLRFKQLRIPPPSFHCARQMSRHGLDGSIFKAIANETKEILEMLRCGSKVRWSQSTTEIPCRVPLKSRKEKRKILGIANSRFFFICFFLCDPVPSTLTIKAPFHFIIVTLDFS